MIPLRRSVPVLMGLILLLAASGPASAAETINGAWQAKVGRSAVNGTATFYTYSSGAGSIVLSLKRLAASTGYTAGLYRGTCSGLGGRVVSLPTIRTNSNGVVARSVALSAASAGAARTAARGTARLSIVLGGGSLRKCATFSAISIPPPPPTPTPCGSPDVCLGQSVFVQSLAISALSAEIWTGSVDAAPIPGYVFVTVQVKVVPDPKTIGAASTKLDYFGLEYRVTTPTLLTWYSMKPGVIRQPALVRGVTSADTPLIGWLTFEVPAAQAATLRLVPVPGVYIRLY
jgi:hypothetical protein